MRRDEFLPPKADCHGGELDRAKREREGSRRAIIPELGKNTATGGEMTARQPRPSSGASPESLACRVYRMTATRQQRQGGTNGAETTRIPERRATAFPTHRLLRSREMVRFQPLSCRQAIALPSPAPAAGNRRESKNGARRRPQNELKAWHRRRCARAATGTGRDGRPAPAEHGPVYPRVNNS